jgi:hypothetical protein
MLFKVKKLQEIKDGKVSLAFRKWAKARVKKGSLLKTAVGLIEVVEISEIQLDSISEQDAQAAGYKKLEEL